MRTVMSTEEPNDLLCTVRGSDRSENSKKYSSTKLSGPDSVVEKKTATGYFSEIKRGNFSELKEY